MKIKDLLGNNKTQVQHSGSLWAHNPARAVSHLWFKGEKVRC